jgi:hypothetical protein
LLYKKILDGAVTSDEARSLEKQISSWEENEKDIIKDKGRSFKVLLSDGSQKLVFVDTNDPLDFEKMVEITTDRKTFYRNKTRKRDFIEFD